jgi:hypothetical protein
MIGTKLKTKAKPAPETRRLGYARVSTYGQTLDAQLEQLRAAAWCMDTSSGSSIAYCVASTNVAPKIRDFSTLCSVNTMIPRFC